LDDKVSGALSLTFVALPEDTPPVAQPVRATSMAKSMIPCFIVYFP
jgi:hypothetical protein